MQRFQVKNATFARTVAKNEHGMNFGEHLKIQPNGKHRFIVRAYVPKKDENVLTFVIFSTFKVNGNNWEY
jgi:hypothetical protein